MKITDKIEKIIVIDLAFIGDVVLATPVTRALKENYPQAKLTMLTVPLTATIAQLNPYVDDVMVYDKNGKHKGLRGMFSIARQIRRGKFTMAVCLNFAVRGAAVAWLAGIKYRLGYDAQHAGMFLTHTASSMRKQIQHETLNHLCVLNSLGLTTQDSSVVFSIPPEVTASLQRKINTAGKPFVVVCPFGSYSRKSLSLAKYQEIIAILKQKTAVYLIGGKKESSGLQEIAQNAGLAKENVLAGTLTLPELAAFIATAQAMLTVDTGPMHMAQAVGTSVAALFGPTDPKVWGPRGDKDILFYQPKDCSPCWGKGECKKNDCLEQFSAEDIAAGVLTLVAKSNGDLR